VTFVANSSGQSEQQVFEAAMQQFYGSLKGPVGMMVKDLDSDFELTWNQHQMFPTASTLKVPLLYELYRQADAGEVDLTERVTLLHKNRVPGSGVYQTLDEGLQPTFHDLAELMITVSDNWATDIIFTRLGQDRVAAMLAERGMENSSLPMTIWELFCATCELDPADPAVTYDSLKQSLKDSEPPITNRARLADRTNDVSSAADMVSLLTAIHGGVGLTETSREAVIEIMKHQNFTSIIPFRLPPDQEIETAHKTGSLKGVKNDVGLVYSPKVNYVIAFFSMYQEDVPAVVDAMSHASRWVWDYMSTRSA
jgi:beta-lactamase class A